MNNPIIKFSFSIIPKNYETNFNECKNEIEYVLNKVLLLESYISKTINVKGKADSVFWYNDFKIIYPTEQNISNNGFYIEFSNNSLIEFLKFIKKRGVSIKSWLSHLLLPNERYYINISHFDFTFTDKNFKYVPKDIIPKCIKKKEYVCQARIISLKNVNTIQFGKDRADTNITFKIDNGVFFCTFQNQGLSSNSIVKAYSNDNIDFQKWILEFLLKRLRFVVLNDVNISRCKTKRWWYKFLVSNIQYFPD